MYPRVQPVEYVVADAIEISFHLVVPEPKGFETFVGEMAISRFIFGVSGMLATVDFYDQLASEADEIEDVTIERHLPLELEAFQLASAQRLPQHVLGPRCVGAHGSRVFAVCLGRFPVRHWRFCPSLVISKDLAS